MLWKSSGFVPINQWKHCSTRCDTWVTEMPSFQGITISIPHLEMGSGEHCLEPQHSALRWTPQCPRETWKNTCQTPETESGWRTTWTTPADIQFFLFVALCCEFCSLVERLAHMRAEKEAWSFSTFRWNLKLQNHTTGIGSWSLSLRESLFAFSGFLFFFSS